MVRAAWLDEMTTVDPGRLIFLDGTSTPTTLIPLRGRSRHGERVLDPVPRGRWGAVTLTPSGVGPGLQMEWALDRDAFETFVTEALVPTLRPGDVVVLDGLSVHKSAQAQQAIAKP